MKTRVWLGSVAAVAVLLNGAGIHAQEAPRHAYVRVVVGKDIPAPVSGRLLVFAENATAEAGKKDEHEPDAKKKVDISEFHPTNTSVAAVEIHDVAPGSARVPTRRRSLFGFDSRMRTLVAGLVMAGRGVATPGWPRRRKVRHASARLPLGRVPGDLRTARFPLGRASSGLAGRGCAGLAVAG